MFLMALLPGMPKIPFLLIGGLAGAGAFLLLRQQDQVILDAADAETALAEAPMPEEPISSALQIDLIRL